MAFFARKLDEGRTSATAAAPDHLDSHSLTLNIKAALILFLSLLYVIFILHSLGQFIRIAYGYDYALGFVPLFYLYAEQNIPTWFSSTILIICSVLLYVIAITKKQNLDPMYKYWLLLCFVFLFLSADETAMIHEKIGHLTNRLLPDSVPSAWAIPYTIILGLLGVSLVRFLRSIPPKYGFLFCLSGVFYAGGALGLEFFEAMHIAGGGEERDLRFTILVTIEEIIEIGAVIIFLHSLLLYVREHMKTVHVTLR